MMRSLTDSRGRRRLVDPKGYDGTGEARHQDAGSSYGDQVTTSGRRSSRSVWSDFHRDMSEGAWQQFLVRNARAIPAGCNFLSVATSARLIDWRPAVRSWDLAQAAYSPG
jgi:hypothetical protein